MNFKITTLIENTVTSNFGPVTGEHGLSFFIDTGSHRFLFDTGQGMSLLNNAKILGIDLTSIEAVILSHGHYDHTGGLARLVEKTTKFKLIAHPDVFEEKLACIGANEIQIGCPIKKEFLVEKGIDIRFERNSKEIFSGVMTTGEIPMVSSFEEIEPMFFVRDKGNKRPDLMPDDQALILDTTKGIVVIFGCAHRGPINTLKQVLNITGEKKIFAIMGGLHLLFADLQKLGIVINQLKSFGVERVVVGHCTGFGATVALANAFGNGLIQNTVGNSEFF